MSSTLGTLHFCGSVHTFSESFRAAQSPLASVPARLLAPSPPASHAGQGTLAVVCLSLSCPSLLISSAAASWSHCDVFPAL
ncbi:hypothetical protein PC117_g1456 [Phytophthora cactorum]|uniref:Uncharacterized protein n=1 Tax=Phytophthora cactorum TaxID=29920 RepID=A0A8T1ERC0_9STRA|nr:hypothetical protein PC117_g1456 [Phytophthora cactorum]KAG3030742.1 hypothetical protein PC120_g3542 [Phytophthora cactorum]